MLAGFTHVCPNMTFAVDWALQNQLSVYFTHAYDACDIFCPIDACVSVLGNVIIIICIRCEGDGSANYARMGVCGVSGR